MSGNVESSLDLETPRELPARIVIPPIKGEMVHLRPACVDDLPRMDELDAYYGASRITGKDEQAERAVVHTWVRRSEAWAQGQSPDESGVGDPESRRTIAWAVLTDADHDDDGVVDAASTDNVIGMIFLIDIDGWSRSARIQVVLGRGFRGRGYSRDLMPRVMTYGFAPEPAGLGMHRIWVAVPEKNTRSRSVYRSLGFEPSGTSRDALWDAENGKYQDLIVMDTLVDEYDPIRSLDAFGMHVIEDNPGVREALSAREHSIAIRKNNAGDGRSDKAGVPDRAGREGQPDHPAEVERADRSGHMRQQTVPPGADTSLTGERTASGYTPASPSAAAVHDLPAGARTADAVRTGSDHAHDVPRGDEESNWPYGQNERKSSKEAWWRILGRGRKRDVEE